MQVVSSEPLSRQSKRPPLRAQIVEARGLVAQSIARPYRVPLSLILLVSLVPLYILIPALYPPSVRNVPATALDRAFPLLPSWALIYGALYGFLILLPIFVVRQEEQIRRTVNAYLFIWIAAYIFFFWIYPTEAPRPARVIGEGFAVWGLRALYSSDPPYNCFPSLHVAHSYVSAFACFGVHRRLGIFTTFCATLVALSTLFTKQHWVLDVIAGAALAVAAYTIFMRRNDPANVPDLDRRVAPALAAFVAAVIAVGLLGYWLFYLWSGERQFDFAS